MTDDYKLPVADYSKIFKNRTGKDLIPIQNNVVSIHTTDIGAEFKAVEQEFETDSAQLKIKKIAEQTFTYQFAGLGNLSENEVLTSLIYVARDVAIHLDKAEELVNALTSILDYLGFGDDYE